MFFGFIFPTLKSSSCCVSAHAASCFILHPPHPPLPWRDGLFIIYFSLWYKNKTIFPLFFFLLRKILSGCPEQQYRIMNAADVCKLMHDLFSLPVSPHSYCCDAFRRMRDFIFSTAATGDSPENCDGESFSKTRFCC